MLDEACRLLLDEVSLPGSALGGKVEFRRTLIVSLFFKFYLEVLQELKADQKLPPESTVSALGDSDRCSHTRSWTHSSEARRP
jgi:aldehyde oxidase